MDESCQHTEPKSPGSPSGEQILGQVQARSPYPLAVSLSLTNACNFRCPHCEVLREDGSVQMHLDEIESLFDDLARAGVLTLVLTGGEPTLRPDLVEIVEMAASRRFWVKLKTNAFFLKEQLRTKLISAGLAKVDVSIYHCDARKNDLFVGKAGALSKAINSLVWFIEEGIPCQASILAMEWNIVCIPSLMDVLEEKNIPFVVDPIVVPSRDPNKKAEDLRPDIESFSALLKDSRLSKTLEGEPRNNNDSPCNAGVGVAYIAPNGDVMLCERFNTPIGNVRKKSFVDIWKNSQKRNEIASTKWKDLKYCATCNLSRYCQRCPAVVLAETGDLLGKSEFTCSVARAFARAAGRKDV